MIYCINPNCDSRENLNEATVCASCGVALLVNNRLTLIKKISLGFDTETFEVIDNRDTFSGSAGSHKILKILKVFDSERLQAFQDEALILQSLVHKAIPRVDVLHDFFELEVSENSRKVYCIIMQKFEGITLEQFVEEYGAINQKKAVSVLQRLGEILHYIQTEEINDDVGIIHRDVKPSNIIVQPGGELALIDFGFALIISDNYRKKLKLRELARVQSGLYTAIEQIEQRPIIQSDYYALGMTMIFAVTGKQLYTIDHKKNSWDLEWQKYVKLDKPFVQLLEQLTEQSYVKRPTSPDDLIRILNQTLPEQLKQYSRYRSKTFRISALFCFTVFIIGLLQFSRLAISYQYLIDGNKALNEHRYNDAKQSYQWAARIYPSSDAYNNIGFACSQLSELDCEEQNYKAAIDLSPNDWVGYYHLGNYFEDAAKPDYSQAEFNYRQAVKLSQSKSLLPINDLARILLLKQDYVEAKKYIDLGLPLSKKEPKAEALLNRSLGWMYVDMHQYTQAESYLREAKRLDPTLIGPHCLLAKVQEAAKLSARKEIELCLTLNGHDFLNIEVLRWRKERLDKMSKQKSL